MKAIDTFNSEEAEHYQCRVEAYTSSHSMLLLRIQFEGYVGFMNFSFVQFFNAPRRWQGLGFQIASPQMTLDFMRESNGFDRIRDEDILERHKLFYLEKPRLLVQIVAEKVDQIETRPLYASRLLR